MPRNATPFNLTLALDPHEGRVASQLSAALIRAIAEGQLSDGDPLPSTRVLASNLRVARSAVVAAYEELTAAGFLVATPGASTRVGPGAREASLAGAYASTPSEPVPTSPPQATAPEQPGARFDLRPGYPDASLVSTRDWNRAWRAAAAGTLSDPAAPPTGEVRPGRGHAFHRPLQEALANHLRRNRAVVCEPEEVFLFPGVNAALRALVRLVNDPDRQVAFEDPGYVSGRRAIQQAGARIRPVGVDTEGLLTDQLTGDDWACYVTPAHQFPLGSRMSVSRRTDLLAWAETHDGLVLEDDYDGEFRYDVAPMPALRSMHAGAEHVVYLGTASKIVARDLRLAWAVVPPRLRERVQEFLHGEGDSVNPVAAAAMTEFISSGALVRQLAYAQRTYAARRNRFTDACTELLPELAQQGIEAGLHVVLTLPAGADDSLVSRRLRERGLICYALSDYTLTPERCGPGIVCGYARLPETRAVAAVELIRWVLSELSLA
ncbi:PLP-dependent aminotransferase family protein [Naumannella sp. ID2617S]|nr:PLP-dependent aminotransferase family protein [Naumannella sp. ID2617S]